MAAPNSQLEAVLRRFGAQPGITSAQEAQLRAAVVADADALASTCDRPKWDLVQP